MKQTPQPSDKKPHLLFAALILFASIACAQAAWLAHYG
jgi:hypothetical protein